MAFANYPGGFTPIENRAGNPWNQTAHLYFIPSTDTNQYGIGDVVAPATGGDPDGVPAVVKITAPGSISTTVTPPLGVIVGIRVADPSATLQGPDLTLALLQIPATKTRGYYVFVVDDMDIIFEAPTDLVTVSNLIGTVTDSFGTNRSTLVAANKNATFIVNNPVGNSPYSASVVSTASIATTAGLPLKIIGVSVKPDNLLINPGNGIPLRLRLMFNIHAWMGNIGGF